MSLKRSHRKLIILGVLVTIVAIWFAGDYVHSRRVNSALQEFEASIDRAADGVQKGAESFTIPGNDTALLLVHGFNDTPQTFAPMIQPFCDQGYTVTGVRLPGFGVAVDQMHSCSCEDWVQTVEDRVQELTQSGKRVYLVGHSLGGAVCLAVMRRAPEYVAGAALLAPAIDVSNQRSPIFPTRFWRKLGNSLLIFSNVYQSPYDRNDCRDPEHRNPDYKSPFSTRNIVDQTFLLMDDNQSAAESIRTPLFMVLSRNDQVTDWSRAENYFSRLGSVDKELVFYDDSGHALTVDVDREEIAKDIIQFVQNQIADTDPGSQ
ncbi:MAG: alpha/beta fold hydrolase [Pirellulaceae bacterium]|nr:alpha/beta fold hydrolase [Pirellulaceae bacterium]